MDFIYRFDFPDQDSEEFAISIDYCSLEDNSPKQDDLPEWTELTFHACPNCTLDAARISHCPLATRIADIIDRFESLISYHDVTITVTTDERTYICPTSVQRGLSSLLGLVIATSGCPHTTFLRPMTHFHLPVSTSEETIYRAVGMYFIGQFFRKAKGKEWDLDLSGLIKRYENLEMVNWHIVERIRAVASQDAPLNAIVLLDSFAKNMGIAIKTQLEEIRHLWSAYTEEDPPEIT